MSFAKEVIKNRKAKSLTQEMLADQSNLSIRTIQRIESGEVNPRLSTIKLICSVLDFEYCENPKKPKKKLAYIFAAVLAVLLIISSLIISFDTESVSGEEGSSSAETAIEKSQITKFILKASLKELKETDFDMLNEVFEGNEPDTEITIGFELEGAAFFGESKIETFTFKEKGTTSMLKSMTNRMQKALSKLEPAPEESQNPL
jgi:transcriptional regulator with XRE-family HTH domain